MTKPEIRVEATAGGRYSVTQITATGSRQISTHGDYWSAAAAAQRARGYPTIRTDSKQERYRA